MGEKSVQKRQYILEKAREVFIVKGFKNVTMKDIVEACEISRGGLYLYFESTKQIFLEVLKLEEEADDSFAELDPEEADVADMLALFFKIQKKELLKKKNNLSVATYEFFFENKLPKKENVMKKQFDIGIKILEKLIEEGMESEEFYTDNPIGCARNAMYVIEGLRITSQTTGITEEAIDNEILFIMQGFVLEE